LRIYSCTFITKVLNAVDTPFLAAQAPQPIKNHWAKIRGYPKKITVRETKYYPYHEYRKIEIAPQIARPHIEKKELIKR